MNENLIVEILIKFVLNFKKKILSFFLKKKYSTSHLRLITLNHIAHGEDFYCCQKFYICAKFINALLTVPVRHKDDEFEMSMECKCIVAEESW